MPRDSATENMTSVRCTSEQDFEYNSVLGLNFGITRESAWELCYGSHCGKSNHKIRGEDF